jgi:Glycosyl hydrolases family 39
VTTTLSPRAARRLLATGATAGLAALAALPATGNAAVAAVQDDVLSTVSLANVEARLEKVGSTGARVARVDVFWSRVAKTRPTVPASPGDPAYDWTVTDQVITGLRQRGIRPIVSVYSTPRWASGGRFVAGTEYNPHAPSAGAYAQFMRALATRYNGTWPSPTGVGTLPRVSHYEIWNEPNLKSFFRSGARTSVAKYISLVRAAYPQIKRANGRAIVIAGVGGPRSTGGEGNISAKAWMTAIVRSSAKFDAYSQHIYPYAPPRRTSAAFPSWSSLPEMFEILDRKKRGMKLYITEAGYTTKRTPFRTVRVSLSQQRTYLKQIFALKDVKSPRVPVVVWFNLQDNQNWPGGLFLLDGRTKPSFAPFRVQARKAFTAAQRRELLR